MGTKSKPTGYHWIFGIDDKITLFCFCIYVDTMDYSAVSFRSTDEAGMAEPHTAGVVEYGSDGGGHVVVEEIADGTSKSAKCEGHSSDRLRCSKMTENIRSVLVM